MNIFEYFKKTVHRIETFGKLIGESVKEIERTVSH